MEWEMEVVGIPDWTELAFRSSDGIEVVLLWSRSARGVKVAVTDRRDSEYFEFPVASGDALAAFYHPFAYAAAGAADHSRRPELASASTSKGGLAA